MHIHGEARQSAVRDPVSYPTVKEGFGMFISLARPQVDMVLGDNVFTSGTAADFAPLSFHLNGLNQANAARFFQQRLHEMSFNPIPLKGGWPEPGPKQESLQHGLPTYGFYPGETQHAGERQSETDTAASRPTSPSYVSHYTSSTGPRAICPPGSHLAAGPQHLDSSYWQVPPGGNAPFSSFAIAPHCGEMMWEHLHQGISPSMLEYDSFALGAHAGVYPQPGFRTGEGLHGMTPPGMSDRDSAGHGSRSTDSKLYASSGMLQAMVLSDGPGDACWSISSPASQYDDEACLDPAASGHTRVPGNTWSGPPGDETVSPKMLRIRPTPSPSSSSESIRATFLAGANSTEAGQSFLHTDNGPRSSKPARPLGAVSKARKLLPANPQSGMPRRQLMGHSDLPSSSRKLNKRRSMPRLAPRPRSPSALPRPSRAPSTASTPGGGNGDPAERERMEFADRCAKDDFLVKHKQSGMTYREIRRLGGFTEAESTLRGRYRTLTKSREARVRKPEWSDEDVSWIQVNLTPEPLSSPSPPPITRCHTTQRY